MESQRPRINTLQSLRCMAFIGVMFAHTGFRISECQVGPWGVSLFLVISGFTMIYSYYGLNRVPAVSVKENLQFACHKLKRLYLLYIILILMVFVLLFTGDEQMPLGSAILKLFLNILLIQGYIPLANNCIVGVSWYLCVAGLFYFIFPWILQWMERKWSIRRAGIMIILTIGAMAIIGLLASLIPNEFYDTNANPNPIWEYKLTKWFVYYFPPTRMCEVFIGCNLGYLYIETNKDRFLQTISYNWLEIAAVLLSLLSLGIAGSTYISKEYLDGIIALHPELWWRESLLFVPGSILLIYTFAIGRGAFSRLLTNRVTLYIARVSPYAFLIHWVVFKYLEGIMHHLPGLSEQQIVVYSPIVKVTIGLALTITASEVWIHLTDWYRKARKSA